MDKLSTRLPKDTLDALESFAAENDLTNAAAARDLIQSALEDWRGPSEDERIQSVREEYEAEIADLETELERAKRERRQLLAQREEHADLVRAVEREQSLAEKRARASVFRRFRWWLGGMDDE